MEFTQGDMDGVFLIDLDPLEDERGYFMRVYDQDIFNKQGLDRTWVQDSLSYTVKEGTLRGLHFQFPPRAETKLVHVRRGTIFDVYLDLRAESPMFGQWGSIELSGEDNRMLCLPRGLAHGFCTLTDDVEIFYRIDNYYDSDAASTIHWKSPELDIPWPVTNPTVSEKDANANSFSTFLKEHGNITL